QSACQQPRPDPERDRFIVKQTLQRRRIGKQNLQDNDRSDTERQVLVAKMSLERKRRVEQVTAVQQIKHLANRKKLDRGRTGRYGRARLRHSAISSRRKPRA